MKAWQLDLSDYKIDRFKIAKCPHCSKEINDTEKVKEDYGIKKVIANIMCHPSLQHKGFRFYTVSKVASKIADCDEDELVLDNTEYSVIKESFDTFKGYGRNDGEMVRRVYEAEQIDIAVPEKKKKKK